MKRNVLYPLAVPITLALGLSGCGGSDSDDDGNITQPEPVNQAPSINFVLPESSVEKAMVAIESGATDTDGTISSYLWQQTAGPDVEFNAEASTLEFTAPSVTQVTPVSFELTITDDDGAKASDSVTLDINRIDLEYAISGSVIPSRYANGMVEVIYGIDSATGEIAADGSYSLTLLADDDTPVTTVAKFVAKKEADDPLTLVALQPSLSTSVEQQNQPNIAKNIVSQTNPQLSESTLGPDVTVITTAAYSLMVSANNGEELKDQAALSETEQQVSVDALLETAAVAQLVIEGAAVLPDASTGLTDVLSDNTSYNTLVSEIESESPGLVNSTAEEIAEDPANLPSIEANALPASFYIGAAAAPTFVSRGEAGKYSLQQDGTGTAVTNNGQMSFKWSTADSKLNISDISGGTYQSYYWDLEGLGFTAEEITILNNNGYYQLEVTNSLVAEVWTLLATGNRVDQYRVSRIVKEESEVITIDGIDYQYESQNEYTIDNHLIKSFPESYQFTADLLQQTWVLPVYNGEQEQGAWNGILGEKVSFASDGTGSTAFTNKAFTWSIDGGKLNMQFADFNQKLIITSIYGTDLGLSAEVMTSDRHFIQSEPAVALDVPESFDLVTGTSQYWQTIINSWNLISWDNGRLKACWDESSLEACQASYQTFFGFQFTDAQTAQRVSSWETPLPTVDDIDGDHLTVFYADNLVTMQYDKYDCDNSDPNYYQCRARDWEVVKVSQGVLGQRIYVIEYDLNEQIYDGYESIWNIGPRLNTYEKIDVEYFLDTAPETLKPNAPNGTINSLGRMILSPSKQVLPKATKYNQ